MKNGTRQTPTEMYPIVKKYLSGNGQTQRNFCHTEQISVGKFQYWLRHFHDSMNHESVISHSKFIELDLCGENSAGIIIKTKSGTEIRIPL